jgi:hypothetical protein
LVQRFFESVNLRFGSFAGGLADLGKELGSHKTGQHADDDHYDKQFQQSETLQARASPERNVSHM